MSYFLFDCLLLRWSPGNEVAKQLDLNIYYIDKKAETSDEATIAKVEDVLKDILTEMDGKPHLPI